MALPADYRAKPSGEMRPDLAHSRIAQGHDRVLHFGMLHPHPARKRYPDFLGIGATRGGSSWLHHVLANHKDVWLTPEKELHFFDRPMYGRRTIAVRTRQSLKRFKPYLKGHWRYADGLAASLAWDCRYLFLPRADDWYASLFAPAGDRLAGEVTPAYAVLDEEAIRRIDTLNPRIRAIYILRHPIERGWSGIVNDLAKSRKRSISEVPVERMLEMIDKQHFLDRSNYAANIRRWRSVIGEERLFVGYFDDICQNPKALVDGICEFLGIRGAEALNDSERLFEIRNASQRYSADMPPPVARYLARRLYPMVHDMNQLLGGHTERWLRDTENLLAETG